MDVAGTVGASAASGFAAGDDVFGIALSGGHAELATASAAAVATNPAGLTFD